MHIQPTAGFQSLCHPITMANSPSFCNMTHFSVLDGRYYKE
jgi:hypothetical protein